MDTPKSEQPHVSGTAYLWTVPGKPVAVHMDWAVIERMLPEIMRGFGSVPRRGAEVGGILLGRVGAGRPIAVHVTGFEVVRCEHEQGPSFILSARDREHWLEIFERTRFAPTRDTYAVGYYRSHTRDGLALAPEDLTIMAEFFPAPHNIALLVKPFASRTSQAGFFIYEDGSIRADASHLEFPFVRRFASRASRPEVASERRERPLFADLQPPIPDSPDEEVDAARVTGHPQFDSQVTPPSFLHDEPPSPKTSKRRTWTGAAVALFLTIGALLALAYFSGGSAWLRMQDPYALGLSFTTASDNLHLNWNRDAPVIRSASRGVLTITDGGTTRQVELGSGQLQHGSVVYRRMSNDIVLKLEVFANDRNSVAEILKLQLTPQPVPAGPPQQVPAPTKPQP
jgi:hypothetical protein